MKKWILSTVMFYSFITLNVGVIFAENAACERAKKKWIYLLIKSHQLEHLLFVL